MASVGFLRRMTRRNTPRTAADTGPLPVRLEVRVPSFDFSETPLHWIPDDPQTAHTINVLHLLLPQGERWFCRAFTAVMPRVKDRGLRMQMRGFTGQESVHATAHAELHELLERNDIDPHDFLKYVDWLFDTALSEQPFNFPLGPKAQERWDLFRMAGVAAVEHYTGLLGSWLLRNADALEAAGADEAMMNLLKWHAAEEVEHQAVAHTIYRHLEGPEYLRWLAMLLTLPILPGFWLAGTVYMQRRDPYTDARPTVRSFMRAGRQHRLPTLRFLFASVVPEYFKRDYYPGKDDPEAVRIADEYLKYAPGVTHEQSAASA